MTIPLNSIKCPSKSHKMPWKMPWPLTSREDLASLGQLEELVVRLDAGLWASADASPHRSAGCGAGGAWDDRHQGGGTWEAARGGAGMVEATDDGIMTGIATLCLSIYYYCYGNIHINPPAPKVLGRDLPDGTRKRLQVYLGGGAFFGQNLLFLIGRDARLQKTL